MTLRLLLVGWIFLLTVVAQANAESCPPQQQDQTAAVSHVYDADTLTLMDGTRVRLIGIDAPELGRDGRPHEPYALEGRDFLRRLMDEAGHRVTVHRGEESHDRHGRLLAYLFLPDGRNINRLLLEQGYVMQVFIAPNTAYAECLQPYEKQARKDRLGIWSQAEYEPGIPSSQVPDSTQGAAIVYGRVVRIGESRDNLWLNLEGRVALQMPKADLDAFYKQRLRSLEGQKVRARGWLVQEDSRHHDWRMRINTSLALEFAPF